MKIKLLLTSITLTLLSACGSDGPTDEELFQNFAENRSGLYQAAFEQESKAKLIQLSIHSISATLILIDDRDNKQLITSTYDDSNKSLSFANIADCNAIETSFECTINGQELTLEKQNKINDTSTIVELSGDYVITSNDQLGTIKLTSDGKFTASFSSCEINGNVSLESSLILINEVSNSCTNNNSSGVVRLDTLYRKNDTLEVLLPDSPLSGFWLQ